MKYKVGDKVKIKSIEWYNTNKNSDGSIEGTEDDFIDDMSEYCGKIATIVSVYEGIYNLDIDDLIYSWCDWMFEDCIQPENKVEDKESLVKTLKIDVPDGYVIDEEKSSFQEIVFKKQSPIITWDFIHNGVEIITDCEHFIIRCDVPALYCNWNDAQRYIQDDENWVMPSVNQLKVVKKHLVEINKVIRDHDRYEICGNIYWCNNYDNLSNTAKCFGMNNGIVFCGDKDYCQNVVIFVKNI